MNGSRHIRILLPLAVLAVLSTLPLKAQKEGAVWYFGANAGLDFNLQYPVPLTNGQINTREGVASICDKEGNLLFYTDGQTVYDKRHEVMDNGQGLLGDVSSTQSSIVVPKPGSTTLYYIFTVDKAGTPANPGDGLHYSIVDITQNFGNGRVLEKNSKLPGTQGRLFTEKITAVKHSDGKSYWILAHEFDTWIFYEFLLTETGLTLQNTVGQGTIHRYNPDDRDNRGATGYLKSSPKGDLLAVAVEGMHFFELFSFDSRNGAIRLLAKMAAGSTADLWAETQNAYGVEFSPTGNFLYGSTRKGGIIYQWSLTELDALTIQRSVKIVREDPDILCGALQLAFNGKIYVSLGGQPYLGVIKSPIQAECNYTDQGASLMDNATGTGGRGYFGLPTFLSDFFKAAEFYFENTCFGDRTIFYPSTPYGIEGRPVWVVTEKSNGAYVGDFTADPNTLQGSFVFPRPGVYVVTMRATQFGSTINYSRDVTINELPELNFPDTSNLCKGSYALLDAGEGAFYEWSDNQNLNVERYRKIYTEGIYTVKVTHYNGCSASDNTRVVEVPVPVIRDPGIAPAACGSSNGSITITMENVEDQYDFKWKQFPENATNRVTGLPSGVYEVTITSQTTGCPITAKLTVGEVGAPEVKITPSVTGSVCAGTRMTLRAEGAANYIWEDLGETVSEIEIIPWFTTTYIVKGYTIDPDTGKECSSYGEITITVKPYNLPQLGRDREVCEGDTVELDGGSAFTAWNWSNGESTQRVSLTSSYPELILFATDQNNCILSDTINIHFKPLPVNDLGEDLIICEGSPLELSGGTGDVYEWNNGATTRTLPVTDSGEYILRITTNGCYKTDTVNVTVKPLPEVNLGRDTTVCVSDPVTLNGGSGDSYYWLTGGETTQEITTNVSGQYILEITLDGCANRDTLNLTIKPLPEVDLGQDTTYCKGNPVILRGGTGDSYKWSTGDSTETIVVKQTGRYDLSVTHNGCTNSDTVNIRINDPALLKIDSVAQDPVSCPGNRDGRLHIYAQGSGLSYEYSLDGGLTYYDSPVFEGLYGNNNFQIVVREDGACTVSYPTEIVFNEPDSIRLNYRMVSPSCETCPDGEINLSIRGGTPPYSILWSTNDTGTFLSNLVLGKYLVWVTDASKCKESALIDLTMDYPPFEVPNAFTPNGDGFNDTWVIRSLSDFPDCEIKIYNRAGELIWWSQPGYPEPWDGRDKTGRLLPMGAYYYLIWLEPSVKPLKGAVSILR